MVLFLLVILVRKSFICVAPITERVVRGNLSLLSPMGQGQDMYQILGSKSPSPTSTELCETDTTPGSKILSIYAEPKTKTFTFWRVWHYYTLLYSHYHYGATTSEHYKLVYLSTSKSEYHY